MRPILCIVDGTELGRGAVGISLDLARSAGEPVVFIAAGALTRAPAEAHDVVQDAVHAATELGVPATGEMGPALAGERIARLATERGAGVVVLPTTPANGLPRSMFMERIAAGVVHDAPCPVVLVRDGRAGDAGRTLPARTATPS